MKRNLTTSLLAASLLLLSAVSSWASNGCGGGDLYIAPGNTLNITSLSEDPSAQGCPNGWFSFNNSDVDGTAVIASDPVYFANLYSDVGDSGAVKIYAGGEAEAGVFQQGAYVEFITMGGTFILDNPAQSTGGNVLFSGTDTVSQFCTAGYCATPAQIAAGLMAWPTPLTGGPTTYETHIIWENVSWSYMLLQVQMDDQHYHWGAWSTMDCEGQTWKLLNTDAPWLQHGYHYYFRVGYASSCGGAITQTNMVPVNP